MNKLKPVTVVMTNGGMFGIDVIVVAHGSYEVFATVFDIYYEIG